MLEGRSVRSVAGSVGRSKSWVDKQVQRFRAGGYENLALQSKTPHNSPAETSAGIEDDIVTFRKQLDEELRRYTEDHPDVRATRRLLATLEEDRKRELDARKRAAPPKAPTGATTNCVRS